MGKPVVIHGLKTKAVLNGCVGKALSYDHETGRIAVELSSPPAGEPSHVKVKPDNLLFDSVRRADVPELDEKQPRDWLYREGIDPPSAWSALWRLEQVEPTRQPLVRVRASARLGAFLRFASLLMPSPAGGASAPLTLVTCLASKPPWLAARL